MFLVLDPVLGIVHTQLIKKKWQEALCLIREAKIQMGNYKIVQNGSESLDEVLLNSRAGLKIT